MKWQESYAKRFVCCVGSWRAQRTTRKRRFMLSALGANAATYSYSWARWKVRISPFSFDIAVNWCVSFLCVVNTDESLPSVALPVGEGRENLWGKTREAYRHVWENYRDKADWFMKADDDTYENNRFACASIYCGTFYFYFYSYVVLENLRYMLSPYNASEPIAFGHKFKPFVKQGYFSGGAGNDGPYLSVNLNNKQIWRTLFAEMIYQLKQMGKLVAVSNNVIFQMTYDEDTFLLCSSMRMMCRLS